MLMEYVGWKDVRSAMSSIDTADPFAQHRIESALAVTSTLAPPQPVVAMAAKAPIPLVLATTPPTAETQLILHLLVERNS
jgi:hypothetical protein